MKLFFSSSNFKLLRLLLSIICMHLHVLVSAAVHNHKCIVHLICFHSFYFFLPLPFSYINIDIHPYIIILIIQTWPRKFMSAFLCSIFFLQTHWTVAAAQYRCVSDPCALCEVYSAVWYNQNAL